jgi:hypothetical protein
MGAKKPTDAIPPLILRRNADAISRFEMDRYDVFCGQIKLGIIQRPVNMRGENAWQWHINGVSDCRPSGGWAADREAAMAAFRAAWDRWLAALNDEPARE